MNYKKYLLPLFLITATIASGLIISSCDIKSPTEGIEVRLNTITRETLVGTYIYDANTNEAINQTVKVTFSGPNASSIIDETNETKTVFTTKNGALIFGVKDGTSFSEDSPFKVTANIESTGFETRTEVIEILSKGFQSIDFYLINPNTLPSNTDQGSATGTAANGTTTSNVVLTTNGGTTVNIPSGTNLTTSTGAPLSGNITVNIKSIPITPQNNNNVPKNLSISANSSIAPAISIDLSVKDQSGNSASTNLEVKVPFAGGIVNPRTGNDYKAGDTMEIYTFNTTTSLWEIQGVGTLSGTLPKNSLGKTNAGLVLIGTMPTQKVSVVGNSQGTCKANFVLLGLPNNFNYSSLKFFKSNGTELTASNNGDRVFVIVAPDAGLSSVSVKLNGTVLNSNITLSCTSAPVFDVTLPSNLISIVLDITGKCTARDPVVTVNPNAAFSYRKVGTSQWTGGSITNGKATITNLEVGATYEITATYRGNDGTGKFRVNSATGFEIVDVSDPGKIISQTIDATSTPQKVKMVIDIGNECD